MVTDFLPADDLFRTSIRTKGLVLLDTLNSSNFRLELEGAVSLCEMARLAGLVSAMNVTILVEECDKLIHFLDTPEDVLTLPKTLPPEFFVIPEEVAVHDIQEDKRHVSGASAQQHVRTENRDVYKGQTASTSKGQPKDENKAKQRDRRATILGILQTRDKINVKDVSQIITDCSEKTLQRELLGLVAQGVLKKEGERRWSMYSLAGN